MFGAIGILFSDVDLIIMIYEQNSSQNQTNICNIKNKIKDRDDVSNINKISDSSVDDSVDQVS
jgi:hypothetical protein